MVRSASEPPVKRGDEPQAVLSDVDFRPLYQQVKDAVIGKLIGGDWRPGDKLPSEFRLAAEYGVSQGTVRKALDELTAQNVLIRRQGRGTFVATHTPHRALFHFFHLVGQDGSRQLPSSRVLSVETRRATREEEARLELRAGSRVIRIDRVRDMAGRPAIVEFIVVAAKSFPGLARMPKDELPNTLYELYEERYGMTIVRAVEKLRAVAATAREAELLGLAAGAPLLEIDRLALSIEDKPVEWRVSRCETRQHTYLSIVD